MMEVSFWGAPCYRHGRSAWNAAKFLIVVSTRKHNFTIVVYRIDCRQRNSGSDMDKQALSGDPRGTKYLAVCFGR